MLFRIRIVECLGSGFAGMECVCPCCGKMICNPSRMTLKWIVMLVELFESSANSRRILQFTICIGGASGSRAPSSTLSITSSSAYVQFESQVQWSLIMHEQKLELVLHGQWGLHVHSLL